MDRDFWLERWAHQQIGFHQPEGHPALAAHWGTLGLERGTRVLVPLSGKSVDMAWLAAQGHDVTGVELSEMAARAFFDERDLAAERTRAGAFDRHAAGGVEILVGDFFDLSAAALVSYDAVYDRAALIALPPATRQRYAEHLLAGLHAGTGLLLITLDYDQRLMDGPPFAVSDDEVQRLFGERCRITCLDERRGPAESAHLRERGLDEVAERVYRLVRR
ncbi:thiopurine S-methyltransferase [Salinisphaera orenii]|uniref:Thiopurine S-methyltransferase n=1 Tax=Salinisphaera orenii YIM 95161 TaxID=1051139 RepID=A0A423PHM7_9GAMM|nr:thiopurine S-methyltransferase [Salinisphaera halophila]ROO25132.1 thiopurine S-methyltransferase [Salinisphaera halophila YIM 95161]